MSPLAVVCMLTFLHYVGAQMRGPVLPLYAAAHGASATGVGAIVAAHMMVAAIGSVPLGRASDVWGRRSLLLAGMIISAVTSVLLPLVEGPSHSRSSTVPQASASPHSHRARCRWLAMQPLREQQAVRSPGSRSRTTVRLASGHSLAGWSLKRPDIAPRSSSAPAS
jgi:MFS family permease